MLEGGWGRRGCSLLRPSITETKHDCAQRRHVPVCFLLGLAIYVWMERDDVTIRGSSVHRPTHLTEKGGFYLSGIFGYGYRSGFDSHSISISPSLRLLHLYIDDLHVCDLTYLITHLTVAAARNHQTWRQTRTRTRKTETRPSGPPFRIYETRGFLRIASDEEYIRGMMELSVFAWRLLLSLSWRSRGKEKMRRDKNEARDETRRDETRRIPREIYPLTHSLTQPFTYHHQSL
jgi:hypothetical protein